MSYPTAAQPVRRALACLAGLLLLALTPLTADAGDETPAVPGNATVTPPAAPAEAASSMDALLPPAPVATAGTVSTGTVPMPLPFGVPYDDVPPAGAGDNPLAFGQPKIPQGGAGAPVPDTPDTPVEGETPPAADAPPPADGDGVVIVDTPPPAEKATEMPVYNVVEYEGFHHGCHHPDESEHHARLSNEVLPLAKMPCRPRALLEIGDPFFHPGRISRGIKLPTCQVLQPSLMVFGSYRTGVVGISQGSLERAEWVHRLDLFANLKLSATERIVVGVNPLDRHGRFTGIEIHPDPHVIDGTNFGVHTLFFEGDFGEIFPTLDRADRYPFDVGFSIGRQPISVQDGILIGDGLDAIGITQNSLRPQGWGMSNLQLTALFAWAGIERGMMHTKETDALLFGFLAEADLPKHTVEFALLGIDAGSDTGDGVFVGLGSTQRLGHVNSTVRVNASIPLEDETPEMGLGGMLTGEFSITPVATYDHVYANFFVGIGEFSVASRQNGTGGPAGRTGILFARPAIGMIGAPISNQAQNAFGAAVGWQRFFCKGRRQVVFEVGGRESTNDTSLATVGGIARFQQAVGEQGVFLVDAYVGWRETDGGFFGGRFEYLVKF